MKKTLLMALSIAMIVGCQKTKPVDPQINGDVIALSSGGVTVAQGRADEVVNQGIRVDFIKGDQIGIFAAFADDQAAPTAPSWATTDLDAQKGIYFENKPAACVTIAATPDLAKFGWGSDGLGGVNADQIYPKKDANFFLYAYYPYTAKTDSVTVDPTDGPQLAVRLNNTTPDKQEDILWAVGKSVAQAPAAYISRKDQLGPLNFKHALAQLQFRAYRESGAQECKFVSIKFTTNAKGLMNITDGTIAVEAMSTTPDNETIAVYDIVENATDIPTLATAGDYTDALEILTNPLMIFPLVNTDLKLCKLEITVYYGASDPDTDPTNVKTFTVDLSGVTTGFNQGKKNQLILGVGQTVIALEGQIEAWEDNADGDDPVIPVE